MAFLKMFMELPSALAAPGSLLEPNRSNAASSTSTMCQGASKKLMPVPIQSVGVLASGQRYFVTDEAPESPHRILHAISRDPSASCVLHDRRRRLDFDLADQVGSRGDLA